MFARLAWGKVKPGTWEQYEQLYHDEIIPKCQSRPFFANFARAQFRIPRQPSVSIQIRHRKRMRQPVLIHSYIYNRHISADRPMKCLSGDEIFYRSFVRARVQVEIQHFFPHRREVNQMTLLAGIFLRHLQLDHSVGFLQAAQQRRYRFARLKIDRPVLDLDNDVVVEFPVERVKNVVRGSRAIRSCITPIQMMVVNKGTVK